MVSHKELGIAVGMVDHSDVWRAIDRIATRYGMSPSGLARRAGLDPTTFNKSKRVTKDGKQRWPSTESLAKVLGATGATMAEFVSQMADEPEAVPAQRIPVIRLARAGENGFFGPGGRPSGNGWDELIFPRIGDPGAYGLEVTGDELTPFYRDGDILIVSPGANIRRGDRVVVRIRSGQTMLCVLQRQTARKVEVSGLKSTEPERHLDIDEVDWMARIVWASQ